MGPSAGQARFPGSTVGACRGGYTLPPPGPARRCICQVRGHWITRQWLGAGARPRPGWRRLGFGPGAAGAGGEAPGACDQGHCRVPPRPFRRERPGPGTLVWGKRLSCPWFVPGPSGKVAHRGQPLPSSSGLRVQLLSCQESWGHRVGSGAHAAPSCWEKCVWGRRVVGVRAGEGLTPAGHVWDRSGHGTPRGLGGRDGEGGCSEKARPISEEPSLGKAPPCMVHEAPSPTLARKRWKLLNETFLMRCT